MEGGGTVKAEDNAMYYTREGNGSIDRRTFLMYSAILGVGMAFSGLMPVSESVLFNRRMYKVSRARLAMGTFVAITVMHPSRGEAEDVIGKTFEEMDRASRLFDRYKSSSPIGMLNKEGYVSDLPPEVVKVISRSLYFYKRSVGAFDITVKPIVDLYKEHFTAHKIPPANADIARVINLVDASAIQVTGNTLRFTKEGMGITLDGIAKGYIVDRGMEVIKRHGIEHGLINAGGDLRTIGGKNRKTPWKVAIQDPDKEGPYLDTISMVTGAIATSGSYEVYFDQEKLYHHIVNPKNGCSPHTSTSVTVLAGNAMDADALATTVFVLGPEAGRKFVERMSGTECLILRSDGRAVRSRDWPSVAREL